MTPAERDLLVATAKILRSMLATQLKRGGVSKTRKQEINTDYDLLCGALQPFDHDQPPQPEGTPV